MNLVMEQLLNLFADIIRENDAVTFAYSRLQDTWYCLSLKYEGSYDFAEPILTPKQACERMLAECQFCWMRRHGLLFADLSLQEGVHALSPELSAMLEEFLSPYRLAAQRILEQGRQ